LAIWGLKKESLFPKSPSGFRVGAKKQMQFKLIHFHSTGNFPNQILPGRVGGLEY